MAQESPMIIVTKHTAQCLALPPRNTLILAGRQDHLFGYQDAWNLLDNYPRATFAVLDQAGHFVNIEQDVLCRSLMVEWLDRVEECTAV